MVDSGKDSLARNYTAALPSVVISDLPQISDAPLLERYLTKITARITSEGLSSLYWVAGIETENIKNTLLETLENCPPANTESDATYCIVTKLSEDRLVEPFKSRFDFNVMNMQEFYADSFIIVNGSVVLDVTPVSTDDGDPEYTEDSTVVSLYVGLFNMLKNRSKPV